MVKENIDIIYAKNMRPQCWGEPHSGYTYYTGTLLGLCFAGTASGFNLSL